MTSATSSEALLSGCGIIPREVGSVMLGTEALLDLAKSANSGEDTLYETEFLLGAGCNLQTPRQSN